MAFFNKLRALIEERELTQKQLARELHIPPSTLGGYVQGTSEPDFETPKTIALYFGVSTDYLLGLYEPKTRSEAEAELLRIFRALAPGHQALYLEQGRAFIRVREKLLNHTDTR